MAAGSLAKAKAAQLLASARASAAKMRERGAKYAKVGVQTLECSGAALAIGYWDGKSEGGEAPKFFGIPAETAIAVGLHGVALFGGVGPKTASHLHAIGDGCLAVAAYKFGKETGESAG